MEKRNIDDVEREQVDEITPCIKRWHAQSFELLFRCGDLKNLILLYEEGNFNGWEIPSSDETPFFNRKFVQSSTFLLLL